MPKTISPEKYARARSIVDKTAEPRLKAIVAELNKFFATDGIRVGAEVKWFFDEVGEQDAARLLEEDTDNG